MRLRNVLFGPNLVDAALPISIVRCCKDEWMLALDTHRPAR